MNISIASYAFHGLLRAGQMDVFGYLESVRYRYGLHAADIWNGMLLSTAEDYLRKVREALDERELTLVNLCVDGAHIWEPEEQAREHNHENALAALRAAEILGARTVRIDAGGRNLTFDDGQFDCVVERYREYAQRAHDHGFRVGPESHWGPETVPANMLDIIAAVDSPAFGVLLHFGNWQGPDAAEGDRLVAPYAMHTHVAWNIVTTCLAEKMELLRAAQYTGYWGVEHHTGQHEYAEVAIQVARVRDVLERWRLG
jgi:sugar phosphate isomerase/epimerase